MAAMKSVHYAIILFVIVGLLYGWHMYSQHGTMKQFASGLGVNR